MSSERLSAPSGRPRVLVIFSPEHVAAMSLALHVCESLEQLDAVAELSSIDEEADCSSFDSAILVIADPPRGALRALGAFAHANRASLTGTPLALAAICTHPRSADPVHAVAHRRRFHRQANRKLAGVHLAGVELFAGGAHCARCRSEVVDPTELHGWLVRLGFHLLPADAAGPFASARDEWPDAAIAQH